MFAMLMTFLALSAFSTKYLYNKHFNKILKKTDSGIMSPFI